MRTSTTIKRPWAPCVLAVAVLSTALTAASCSGGPANTTGPGADCAWRLSYGKRVYLPPRTGAGAGAVRHEGAPLGRGSFPGCGDGAGGSTGWGIAVYRIAGVDPAQAVVTADDEVGVTDPGHLPARLSALLGARG